VGRARPGGWAGRRFPGYGPCCVAAVRLCGWSPAPAAAAVEVSVGYVRWVGGWATEGWARAWEGRPGRAARGAEWDAMKWKEREAEWADGRLEREWDGRASGFDGALPLQYPDQTAALQLGNFATKSVLGPHVTRVLAETGTEADPGLPSLNFTDLGGANPASTSFRAASKAKARGPRALATPGLEREWDGGEVPPRHLSRPRKTSSAKNPIFWAVATGQPGLPFGANAAFLFPLASCPPENFLTPRLRNRHVRSARYK
jgi:hypothetical protein